MAGPGERSGQKVISYDGFTVETLRPGDSTNYPTRGAHCIINYEVRWAGLARSGSTALVEENRAHRTGFLRHSSAHHSHSQSRR